MKLKGIIGLVLTVAITASLAGCGNTDAATSTASTTTSTATNETTATESALPADGPEFNLILAHGAPEESDGHKNTLLFKQLVEERSGGKITVDSYPAFQLGSVSDLIQNQKSGEIAMTMGTAGGSTSRAISFLDLPALYNDIEKATEILQEGTKARALIDSEYEKLNVKVLSIMPITYRQVSSNVAIRSIDDFKGLNIRTMENPLHMKFWEALGANPTPLAFSELYVALQQGLVDAQENPLDTIYNSKIYEQQDYIIDSRHVMFFNAFTINIDIWNSMPESYQEIVTEAMAEVEANARVTTDKSIEEYITKLEAEGLEYITLSDADYAKMKELAAPVYDMAREDCGDEVIDEILAKMQ